MKIFWGVAACAVLAWTAKAVEVDGITATVGTRNILRSEVISEMRRTGVEDRLFNEVRNGLIERALIIKAAADSKMTMQEWVVDNRIREIVDSAFGGDRNKLMATLTQQKMPYPDWRKRVQDDLIVGAMRWNVVEKNVTASPSEMQAEFKAHPERYRKGESVSVSVLMVKPGDEKPPAFTERLAKKYTSVNPNEVFQPEIHRVVAKLKKGETSDWVELDGWNFMIRKDDEIAAVSRTFAEAYEDVEANVRAKNSKKLYHDWMDRLKAETYIKVY